MQELIIKLKSKEQEADELKKKLIEKSAPHKKMRLDLEKQRKQNQRLEEKLRNLEGALTEAQVEKEVQQGLITSVKTHVEEQRQRSFEQQDNQLPNSDLSEVLFQKKEEVDYVSATLKAWNMCPTIVKKQMDEQYKEIMKLKSELKTANLKLKMKKNELEKEIKITN